MNRLLITSLMIFALTTMCEGVFWGITHVKVINGLEPQSDVIAHCRSKDDDIGVIQLRHNDSFQFQFRPNFWKKTLFYCSFVWPGQVQWFDIFKHSRDDCKFCTWSRELANEKIERLELIHGQASQSKKGKDFTLVKTEYQRIVGDGVSTYSVFRLFDGHNGSATAIYSKENLLIMFWPLSLQI
ncbi:hypothetical protein ACFX2F_013088 [Malus domestica]